MKPILKYLFFFIFLILKCFFYGIKEPSDLINEIVDEASPIIFDLSTSFIFINYLVKSC